MTNEQTERIGEMEYMGYFRLPVGETVLTVLSEMAHNEIEIAVNGQRRTWIFSADEIDCDLVVRLKQMARDAGALTGKSLRVVRPPTRYTVDVVE